METITSLKLAQLLLCEQLYQKKSIPIRAFLFLMPFTVISVHT